ncbi:MAG: hypothetical protein J6S14_15110 [Clostridia bacterium]|nr:hypothetical protein [Clostridia bacterium]
MTKIIMCPDCNGHGIISECTEYSISGIACEKCFGRGTIEVLMDTADHIRRMDYKELANLLLDFYLSGMEDASARLNVQEKMEEFVQWLKRTDIYG